MGGCNVCVCVRRGPGVMCVCVFVCEEGNVCYIIISLCTNIIIG